MFAREYELIYIVRPDSEEEGVASIQERTQKVVEDGGGHLLRVDDWGKRKLAYEIQNFQKGHFVLVNFLGGSEVVAEAERTLKIDDSILRFLTVKLGDRVDVDTRVAEEETRKMAAAAASKEAAPAESADSDGTGD